MLNLRELIVTQNELRNPGQVLEMMQWIQKGGRWTQDVLCAWCDQHHLEHGRSLIQLTEFEDGQLFVQDGHHRLVATYAGGRYELDENEYQITKWHYKDYREINFATEWFTPFCPLTEVRLPNLAAFKAQVRQLLQVEAVEFIRSHKHLYAVPRQVTTVADLCRANAKSAFTENTPPEAKQKQ